MAHIAANNRAFRRATLRAQHESTISADDTNRSPPRTPRSSPIIWQETQNQNAQALAANTSDLSGKLALGSQSLEIKNRFHEPPIEQLLLSGESKDENPNPSDTKNNQYHESKDVHKNTGIEISTLTPGARRISAFQMAPSVPHLRTQVHCNLIFGG